MPRRRPSSMPRPTWTAAIVPTAAVVIDAHAAMAVSATLAADSPLAIPARPPRIKPKRPPRPARAREARATRAWTSARRRGSSVSRVHARSRPVYDALTRTLPEMTRAPERSASPSRRLTDSIAPSHGRTTASPATMFPSTDSRSPASTEISSPGLSVTLGLARLESPRGKASAGLGRRVADASVSAILIRSTVID